jgi:type II secretory pathway pseudopilin PulG
MTRRLDVAVLIAALGAGAVVAVPRHVQTATDARRAEVTALARGASTAVQLAHSRWLAANQPPTIEGVRGVVAMTYGYPSVATLPLMLGEAETATFTYDEGLWRHASLSADRPCWVSYQPPAAPGQNPAISPQTSGC